MVNLKQNIMYDDYINIGNPAYEPEYECSECGEPMNKPGVCSGACHEASMI